MLHHISFQVCNDNDEDDTVTYSTVKFPSSSAGVSTDPSNLYSTINKQKKHVPAWRLHFFYDWLFALYDKYVKNIFTFSFN